jgi:EEF1A lysine methyltransferase 1
MTAFCLLLLVAACKEPFARLPGGVPKPPSSIAQNRRARRQHLQPPGSPPPPPPMPATTLQPAVLAGVVENHAFEQFYFDESCRALLLELLEGYERPLLLCCPSMAVAAEEAGKPYLLLDRDERFSFLSAYRPFDLFNPTVLDDAYDVILCDPPFANLDLDTLRTALDVMAPDAQSRAAPLYIAYNSRREDELLKAFGTLERKLPLTYCSVKPKTQQYLYLYGPESVRAMGGRDGLEDDGSDERSRTTKLASASGKRGRPQTPCH